MSNRLYLQHKDKLPQKLVDTTCDHFARGLIRLCDPDSYSDVFSDGYSEQNAIVFGTTAFGDFLVWEKDKYVNLVSFSKHTVTVLESGFDFFFDDIKDEKFLRDYFEYDLFLSAVKEVGMCKDDECFTTNPIPYIGGDTSVEKLKVGKLREYNAMSIEMAGKI